MVNPFANTKIKILEGQLNTVVGLLRERGLTPSMHFQPNVEWTKNIVINNNNTYSGIYADKHFFQNAGREITINDLLAGRILEVKQAKKGVPAPYIKPPKKAAKPRKKYITKNTPLVPGDWVEVEEANIVGIFVGISSSTRMFVTPIVGSEKNGRLSAFNKDVVKRFKGKITIKA